MGSIFTIQLKRVNEMTGGDWGLKTYPIFDTAYRGPLNQKILEHYYNQEIGQESSDMFRLAVQRKMNEIMPYYNQLYNSQKIIFDPLSTVNLKTVTTGELNAVTSGVSDSDNTVDSTGNSTSTSDGTARSRAVNSEFPQTFLEPDKDYATGATDVNSENKSTGTGAETGNTTSTGKETNTGNTSSDTTGESTTTGYQGLTSDMILRYRETLMNIDMLIINELQELFMLVWDNGDSYERRGYGVW